MSTRVALLAYSHPIYALVTIVVVSRLFKSVSVLPPSGSAPPQILVHPQPPHKIQWLQLCRLHFLLLSQQADSVLIAPPSTTTGRRGT